MPADPQSDQTTAALSLPQLTIPPGAEIVLELKLAGNPGNLQGVDLTLTYDASIITLAAANRGDLPAGWSFASHSYPGGTLILGMSGPSMNGDAVLARLAFQTLGSKGQSSAVDFLRADLNEREIAANTLAGLISIDTPPVTDLRASPVDGALHLVWTDVGADAHHYELWRAGNQPYFAPDGQGEKIAPYLYPFNGVQYHDSGGGLGNPDINSFYLLRTIDANGRPSPFSNRVAEFDFRLRTGD